MLHGNTPSFSILGKVSLLSGALCDWVVIDGVAAARCSLPSCVWWFVLKRRSLCLLFLLVGPSFSIPPPPLPRPPFRAMLSPARRCPSPSSLRFVARPSSSSISSHPPVRGLDPVPSPGLHRRSAFR